MADQTVNLQIATAYDGRGADAARQGLGQLTTSETAATRAADTLGRADATPQVDAAAEQKLHRLTQAADELLASLRLGVGIDLGGRIVAAVAALPAAFQAATQRGLEFNATVESAQLGVAAILRQFRPEQFATVGAALGTAGGVIEQLKVKATETTATFQDLARAFAANAGAATAAGVPIGQQADLLVLASNAVAGLGISTDQLTQEYRALLTGEIDENAQLARTLGITRETIETQKAQGKLVEFLTTRLGAFGEAGKLAAQTFAGARSNLGDVLDQVLGDASAPVFEELRKDYLALADELRKPEVADALRTVGFEVAHLVESGAALTRFALENSGALLALARGTVAYGAAIAAVQLASLVLGLAAKAAATRTAAAATAAETAALVANTEATAANAAAKGTAAGGAAGGLAGGIASFSGPLTLAVALGTALNVAIGQSAADLDAAARHANDLGAGFDRARGSAGSLVAAARSETAYVERRLEIEKNIAALQAEVKKNTTEVPTDAFGGKQTVTNRAGQDAAQLLQLQQKNLDLLDRVKRGELDVSNIRVEDVNLQRLLNDLTAEQNKQANTLSAALNDRRLGQAPLLEQETALAAALDRQVKGARERLGLLGVDPKSLASLRSANELEKLGDSLRGNAKIKTLEEATALAQVEDRLKAINERLKEQRQADEEAIRGTVAAEGKQLTDLQARRPQIDRSGPEGNREYVESLRTEEVLTRGLRANLEGLRDIRIAAIPGLTEQIEQLKAAREALRGDDSEAAGARRGDLNRQIDSRQRLPDSLDALPVAGQMFRNFLNPDTPPVNPAPNDPVDYGATGYGASAAAPRVPAAEAAAQAAAKLTTALQSSLEPVAANLLTAADAVPGQVEPIGTGLARLGDAYTRGFGELGQTVADQTAAIGDLAALNADLKRDVAALRRQVDSIANA